MPSCTIITDQETDGRWIADASFESVARGMMLYDADRATAVARAKALARRVAAEHNMPPIADDAFHEEAQDIPADRYQQCKARDALANLVNKWGWRVHSRTAGSHITLQNPSWRTRAPDLIWAFEENELLGPKMMARVAHNAIPRT